MTSSNLKKSSQLSHLSSPAAFQSKSSCSLSYRPTKHFPRFYHSSFNLEMDFQLTRGDREAPLSTAFSQLWNQSSIQLPRLKKVNFPRCSVFHRLPVVLPLSLPSSTISTSPYRPQFYSRFDVRLCTELSGTNVSVRAWRLLLLFTLRHRLDVGSLLPSLVLLDFSAHARTDRWYDRLGIWGTKDMRGK